MARLLRFLLVALAMIQASPSFSSTIVRDNDRWVCLGDSITAMDCYPKLLSAVFKHYHPDATLTVINSGVGGDTASDDPAKLESRVLKYNPTVVSIMYGMNECINSWHPGLPQQPILDRYRASLTYMVRTLKAKGVIVLLMSPTVTDPSCHTFFTLEKTVPMLHRCADVMRDVAAKDGAFYVPVQEDYVAYQDALPGGIALSADGVHPSSLGQYRIACTLCEAAGFSRPLTTDKRGLATAEKPAQVTVSVASRFAAPDAGGIPLALNAEKATDAVVTWSLAGTRKSETVKLSAGTNTWTLPAAVADLMPTNGKAAQAIMDVRVGESTSLAVIDLARTAVLHLVNDTVGGDVVGDDGKHVASWKATRSGGDLQFDFDVVNDQFNTEASWPFAKDGLNLMIDLRPTARFADIGVDREVYQAFVTVRDKPFFAANLRMWTGLGLDNTATVAGERTPAGYAVHMLLHDQLNLHTPFNLKARDFIGLLVAVDDAHDKGGVTITANQTNDGAVNVYANNLPILDLKGAISGESVVTVAAWSAK